MSKTYGIFLTAVVACVAGLSPQRALAQAQIDSISVTNVDTRTLGQVTLSGSYTTANANVTLDSVTVFAYPTSGGLVKSGAAQTINLNPQTWSQATVTGLSESQYTFRVEAKFSDGTKYSTFIQRTVRGTGGFTGPYLGWNTMDSSPSSPAAGTVAATGTWSSGTTNPPVTFTGTNGFIATFLSGGGVNPTTQGGVVTFNDAKTWSSQNLTGLTSGQNYYILMQAVASDGNTYCAPVVTLTVQ